MASSALARTVLEREVPLDRELLAQCLHHSCQTRSFLFIDQCPEGVRRLVDATFTGPVNIGSEEMVTINQLAAIVMDIAGKSLTVKHVPGPLGVRGRNSDNRLIREKLGWAPSRPLREGLEKTYLWISAQVGSKARELVAS